MTLKWEAGVAWADAGLGMASLANGSLATGSTVIANGTNLNLRLDASLVLGSLTPGTGGYVELHLIPLLRDGTNYADAAISGATMIAAVRRTRRCSTLFIISTPTRRSEVPSPRSSCCT